MNDWGHHIEAVATALLGKPTSRTRTELRYGSKGSLRVNLETGWWDDFESGTNGGTLAMIECHKGLSGPAAIDWMRCDLHLAMDDRRRSNGASRYNGSSNGSAQHDPRDDGVAKPKAKIVQTYDYTDRDGALLFQVCRMEPKSFRQRKPDGKGGWDWSVKGVTQAPYRLPDLIEAVGDERLVLVVEGEKDADKLLDLGIPATCNAGGAGKWPDDLTPHFAGADVVVIPDNDDPGREHANLVASRLRGVAKRVRMLELPELPIKGDASDWIKAGGTSESLYKLVDERASIYEPEPFRSQFGAVVWGEPRASSKIGYEYLVKGLIPRRETVLIYGPSQCGKSFFTQHVGMCIARGADCFGRKARRGIVVYCAAEAGTGFTELRFPAYRLGNNLASEVLPFACLTKKFDLFGDDKVTDELINEIRALVARLKQQYGWDDLELEAVAIDTLNKVTPAMDEISGRDVGAVLGRLDRIRTALNTGLWLVHHKNAANTGPRGHTSLYAGFETAIEIIRTNEIVPVDEGGDKRKARELRKWLLQKQREGDDGVSGTFILRGVVVGVDEDGDPVPSAFVSENYIGSGTRTEVAKDLETARMSDQRRALYRALKKAVEDYGVSAPPELGLPKTVHRVVDAKYWRQVWSKQANDAEPETVRKALNRANDWLLNNSYIGRSNPWVWLTGKGTKPAPQFDNSADPPAEEPAPDFSDDSFSGDSLGTMQ